MAFRHGRLGVKRPILREKTAPLARYFGLDMAKGLDSAPELCARPIKRSISSVGSRVSTRG
jgi:hypothetical protein